ncbi:hypothetical protein VKT23_009244 [Stygiomarasmius scandens]|uniref:Uncharacterized protein n=1 Tax=Marasmiellus scandens TaxID=2682957 RepID=A0ABR1JET5_9AGAR
MEYLGCRTYPEDWWWLVKRVHGRLLSLFFVYYNELIKNMPPQRYQPRKLRQRALRLREPPLDIEMAPFPIPDPRRNFDMEVDAPAVQRDHNVLAIVRVRLAFIRMLQAPLRFVVVADVDWIMN